MIARRLSVVSLCVVSLLMGGCGAPHRPPRFGAGSRPRVTPVAWTSVANAEVTALNKDLEDGKLTVDVGIYFPSNFDSGFTKVTLDRMLQSFKAAKEIYRPTGVQLNLLWVKTGSVDPRFFAIQANEVPGVPETEYVNSYTALQRHPERLTPMAHQAFRSIVERTSQSSRTVYLIALEDVFYPFLDVAEGRNWTVKSVRTGGLSFPPYVYGRALPPELRGVITITNLQRPDRLRQTIAHEIGHKLINVSHEYGATDPGHEVIGDGGLMLYGAGEEIPAGKAGRYHLERLLLSPFLYRRRGDGTKVWNPDFQQGGHYYDPIYGDKVVHFTSKPKIDPNW